MYNIYVLYQTEHLGAIMENKLLNSVLSLYEQNAVSFFSSLLFAVKKQQIHSSK